MTYQEMADQELGLQQLAPGVRGLVEKVAGMFMIQLLIADPPGQGNVSRYLDGLPKDRPTVAVRVLSEKLAGMLERRGFTPGTIQVAGIGEVAVYFRAAHPLNAFHAAGEPELRAGRGEGRGEVRNG